MFTGCIFSYSNERKINPVQGHILSIVILRECVCNFVFVHSVDEPVQDMFFSLSQERRNAPSSNS